jgi:hypothetical protein
MQDACRTTHASDGFAIHTPTGHGAGHLLGGLALNESIGESITDFASFI